MNIVRQERNSVSVYTLSGRLDAYTAPQLQSRLRSASGRNSARLVVDLCGVTLVDSNGLAELVTCMKRAREMGGDLKLAGLSSAAAIIFELTRLDKAFDIHPDVDAAVAAFGDPSEPR